jgi:ElaB/YqjD/DUF883 family membrane-anchored ribosome-binding protein
MSVAATAKLLEDLQAVMREAEAFLQATAKHTGEQAEAVRSRAGESLQQARECLSTMEEEALQGVRDAAAATQDYVRKNPWQSVAIAAGAGLLIGLLLRRRD